MSLAKGLRRLVNLANWVTRYRLKRPFSRRLQVAPGALVDPDSMPRAMAGFAADPAFDPLSGALDFLGAAYAGDKARAGQVLARLDTAEAAGLFARSDLRKLVIACFRHASEIGSPGRESAALLLDFARRFDPVYREPGSDRPSPSAPSRPLSFDYVERLSPKLRIAVLFRSTAARTHDLGERLISTFAAAGIDGIALPGDVDPGEIGPADLVLVDEGTVFRKDPQKREAQLDRLRKVARRMGQLVPDPWGAGFSEQLTRSAGRYDFLWAMAPTLRERVPVPADKFCLIPFPCGFAQAFDQAASATPAPGLGFCGAIEDYNLHRYFWLLSALARGSALRIEVTRPQADDLGVDASMRRYVARLLGSAACLSLTMRATGERILVGRGFDALRGGRLLVQEYTPDARYYLRPGKDFIEVQGPEDLGGLDERIRAGACEPIREQGAETFRGSYSDLAVVRHLATWI